MTVKHHRHHFYAKIFLFNKFLIVWVHLHSIYRSLMLAKDLLSVVDCKHSIIFIIISCDCKNSLSLSLSSSVNRCFDPTCHQWIYFEPDQEEDIDASGSSRLLVTASVKFHLTPVLIIMRCLLLDRQWCNV